uniref:Putative GT2 n=1 Tax=Magnetococcus massalia (strain MO-1) TaxID=451514 RepID=A0A1S7LJM2_MAGMO|nr:putative GT2 [Candidatus Magnetococcus massalia]
MSDLALAVIIPVLNEAEALPELLADLCAQREVMLEVMICDGGSRDGTRELAEKTPHTLVSSPPGRGRQMNAGVQRSRARWLLFLHADSRLTDPHQLVDALQMIQSIHRHEPRVAGHFPIQFSDVDAQTRTRLALQQAKSHLNRQQVIHGDQGLLIHRDFLNKLGGFDELMPFLEDQRLSELIFANGRWLTLPGQLSTSARRFAQEGVTQRHLLNIIIMAAFTLQLEHFFTQAKALYQQQADTEKLQLSPFIILFKQSVEQSGSWWQLGRYLGQNLWQLALAIDVHRGGTEPPYGVLARFDRWFTPWLDRPPLQPFWTATAWFATQSLHHYFRWKERPHEPPRR